jgi:hypothetical protein
MLILVIILVLVFGGGREYYGHTRWGPSGGAGIGLGRILLISSSPHAWLVPMKVTTGGEEGSRCAGDVVGFLATLLFASTQGQLKGGL